MGGLSWWHWLIIIAAFILIFGAKKLPDAARGVGRSLRILKSEVAAMHEDGDKPATAETNASATVATPPAQIVASPPPAPPVAQPAPAAAQPAASVAPTQQQVAAPTVNGVPVSEEQPKL